MRASPSALRFEVPTDLSAGEPPEARGTARDGVRLLVAADHRPLRHRRFTDLPDALRAGDLVVVNTSDTEPAAVEGRRGPTPVVLHVSGPLPDRSDPVGRVSQISPARFAPRSPLAALSESPSTPGTRASLRLARNNLDHESPRPRSGRHDLVVVELRTLGGDRVNDAVAGERILLPRGVEATLLTAHPDPAASGSRLWRARVPVEGGLLPWLRIVGRPVRYPYVPGRWPLAAYRTIFARPDGGFGSAEMPSAARPFSPAVTAGLRARGVGLAEVVLHTGVSSLEAGETPLPERFRVPPATAAAVNAARAGGGRVLAVGTTVTRALETVAAPDGAVRAGSGWTDLVLGPDRPARTVTGLVTGWHEPQASHLLLLEAVAGRRLVRRAYAAALEHRYLWHEFGDSCLLLPSPR